MSLISSKCVSAETSTLLQPTFSPKDNHPTSNGIAVTKFDEQNHLQNNSISEQHQQTYGTVTDLQYDGKNSPENVKKPGFLRLFKGRSRYVLILCSIANFLACSAFSLLGPFYPLEAEKKGMSLTIIGFVFSVFQLIIFLASPIIGNYLTKIGAKFVFISGIFVGGSCVILFGLLDRCPSGTPFIAMSIICRSVEALGCAGFITASFAIVTSECPEAVGTAFAIMETANGIGYMLGPVIGGALYELGGYGLPFHVIGSLILLNGILIYNYLPKSDNIKNMTRKDSMLSLLRSPLVILSLCNTLVGDTAIAMFDSTFAKHVETFGLSTMVIGLYFVIPPCVYAIVTPFWGYLTDQKNHPKTLLVVGDLVFAVSFTLLGPSHLLPFLPNELWIIVIALVLLGFSFGMLLVPSMKLMVVGAYELDYEANMDTHALVSGLYNSVKSFGGFLGPLTGGVVIQEYGHQVGYTALAVLNLIMMALGLGYFITLYIHRRQSNNGGKMLIDAEDKNKTTTLD